jgi:hypothetical protein
MKTQNEVIAELITTPFMSSWCGRAREGDLFDPDPRRRSGAWAHWAMTNIAQFSGSRDRQYYALILDGKFYNPKSTGPEVVPHIEITDRVLARPDSHFPDRLASAGNALRFPWWVYPEVNAVKRGLFPSGPFVGSVEMFVDAVSQRRASLIDAVKNLSVYCENRWEVVEDLLVSNPEKLTELVIKGFSRDEVTSFFPAGAPLSLKISFDPKLAESSGKYVARRVGVWRCEGVDDSDAPFSCGIVVPRLTRNSQFKDSLFAIQKESAAGLLVRGLLLRRIAENVIGGLVGETVAENAVAKTLPKGYLKSIIAKPGADLPKASIQAATAFVQGCPDGDVAWGTLDKWAESHATMLTVQKEAFLDAHRKASRFVRRGEEPERETVDILLPIGWDQDSRVVRVTYARTAKGD